MNKQEAAYGDPVKGDHYDNEIIGEEKRPRHLGDNVSDEAILSEFSPAEEKRIMHKIDRRLVLTVGFMYCISLMDRTNLSAANIAGMAKDLVLINFRYSIITLVFFITYVVFQFPATIVIKYVGPKPFLSLITLLWGAVMIGMGFVKTWQTMAGLRVILGIFEAGFFPGSVYLLSTWYVRYEVQKRYSVFYIIGSLASACAGILAYGIMQMDGVRGYSGWRWIFIIEGIITCCIAIVGYFTLIDFPDNAHRHTRFLSDREIQFCIARINRDRADAVAEPWSLSKFLTPALDPKVWCFGLIFGMTTTVTYALAYFLPVILRSGMGFSVGAAQCLVAPPYAAAAIWMYVTAYVGDKYRVRGVLVALNAVIAIVGVAILGFAHNVAARYFGVFLAALGSNANVPTALTYQANNIRGHWKRAFASASLVGWGGIGGIAGSLIFRSQDEPTYHPGLYGCITSQLIVLLIVAGLSFKFRMDNKKADRGEKIIERIEGFRYTL